MSEKCIFFDRSEGGHCVNPELRLLAEQRLLVMVGEKVENPTTAPSGIRGTDILVLDSGFAACCRSEGIIRGEDTCDKAKS